MKYLLIILIFFVGCENNNQNTKEKPVKITDILPHKKVTKEELKEKQPKIKIKDLVFTKENNSLIYSFKTKKILLFIDNNKFSKLQLKELNNSNYSFYVINNNVLKRFFKINEYPTIIITKENNNTNKYVGFIPNEILKYEIKD